MKNDRLKLILFLSAALGCLAILAYIINFHTAHIAGDSAAWGTLGDFIGGIVGTVFNFAGVILIYLTFQRQQQTSVLQQFETTFFNLLTIQREMMKSVKSEDGTALDGQEFFEQMAASLSNHYREFPLTGDKIDIAKLVTEYYGDEFERAGRTLGPYHRHLYHLLKYTNSSEIFNQKRKYMDIVQAQMSNAELYCLFYNGISYGSEKLQPLLDTYGFLENIESDTLVFDRHKTLFYPNTRFKYFSKDSIIPNN